jgi:hypothetical protein
MKVDAYIATGNGNIIRLCKYFNRNASVAAPRLLDLSESCAWQTNEYRSLEVLETTSIGIIQVLRDDVTIILIEVK